MKRLVGLAVLLFISGMALSPPVLADFEVSGPDGRRILLQQNGTWRYVEAKDKDQGADDAKNLLLVLERKVEREKSCRFAVRLTNNLPYEVQNIVPSYSAYRADVSLKPGDTQAREFEFYGIPCRDIIRVQVVGGDRCNMGDLNRWSDQSESKGRCLARVRVEDSTLVRFDK
jgi:hypothetical protein